MEYLQKTLFEGTEDISSVTSIDKQIDMVMAGILLSETMVNKETDDEPAFKFFKKKFSSFRELIQRIYKVVKDSTGKGDQIDPDQYFFYIEILETLIYVVLDMCINESASATNLNIKFPI